VRPSWPAPALFAAEAAVFLGGVATRGRCKEGFPPSLHSPEVRGYPPLTNPGPGQGCGTTKQQFGWEGRWGGSFQSPPWTLLRGESRKCERQMRGGGDGDTSVFWMYCGDTLGIGMYQSGLGRRFPPNNFRTFCCRALSAALLLASFSASRAWIARSCCAQAEGGVVPLFTPTIPSRSSRS